jgi:hypothetical protein
MAWNVEVKEAAIGHFAWFGKATGRKVLKKAIELLGQDPLAETKNMKTLRPNAIAERELRLLGKFRILISITPETERVTILLAGEKRGNKLLVSGKEFSAHHESDSAQ